MHTRLCGLFRGGFRVNAYFRILKTSNYAYFRILQNSIYAYFLESRCVNRTVLASQKLRHKSKKSVFRNSETKYFTNLLTNPRKYVRIPLRNKMFHKPFAMQKLMRGYYEKER